MRFLPFGLLIFLSIFSSTAKARDYNDYVLRAVRAMPDGGRYSKLEEATRALSSSIWSEKGLIYQNPSAASPVYCSGSTYQVFIDVVRQLQTEGLPIDERSISGLLVNMQPDGTDTWGRWNSNGPGTSRLFYELGLGKNTMNWNEGKPGDFLKLFFNEHIGKLERGHSVVYLGTVVRNGVSYLRYWSSDAPAGRGTYEMPKSRIVRAIFSRLQNPEALNNIPSMPVTDAYLASMLTESSTVAEMRKKIGLAP